MSKSETIPLNPLEAYRTTSERAQRMLRLHDGLINIRKKGIRSDWKTSFCKLMYWRQDCKIERVDSSDAIIILRQGAVLSPNDFTKDSLDDLLRGALVLGVSALDRYVHERVVKGIIAALKEVKLSKNQEEFKIPAVIAIRISEAVARAGREGKKVRPSNEVRKKIQDVLHQRPFQSWREVEYAFSLIGINGLSGIIQNEYKLDNIEPVKNQLNKIVARRNLIAHEGDLIRHKRGGNVRPNEIGPKFVRDSFTFLDDLVNKLETVK